MQAAAVRGGGRGLLICVSKVSASWLSIFAWAQGLKPKKIKPAKQNKKGAGKVEIHDEDAEMQDV